MALWNVHGFINALEMNCGIIHAGMSVKERAAAIDDVKVSLSKRVALFSVL